MINKPKRCNECNKQMRKLGRNLWRCPVCLHTIRRCDKCKSFDCECGEKE